jgi:tRNA threonylcarbamoyladenosine biosynthesis protein TsaB
VRILAIETSAEPCSVALADGARVVQRRQAADSRVAERALSMVAELLAEQSVTLSQVDAFAFGRGPGSFTGLRVACALVQGLAFAHDRPVVPIGSLRALAYGARRQALSEDRSDSALPDRPLRVMAAINARMGQIYWAVYEGAGAEHTLATPALATPEQIADLVAQWRPQVIAGDALRVFPSAWAPRDEGIRLPAMAVEACMIAQLARTDLAAGRSVAARDASPEYVRDQVALTTEQRARDKANRRELGREGQVS